MDSLNRIPSLSITPDVERQTPRNDFGDVMAHAVSTGVQFAAAAVGGMGGPVLSAAVSAGRQAIGSGTACIHAATPVGGGGSTAGGAPGTGGGTPGTGSPTGTPGNSSAMDLLEAQRALQSQGQQFNAAYLQLQDQMQRESRDFNAVSNIMKVRHDSAKAAINNIH